jgi:redox-sensitive bicupin YhaK (pirin superfamily)
MSAGTGITHSEYNKNKDKGFTADYEIKAKGNGVYAFVLRGDLIIDNQDLKAGDGLGYLTAITREASFSPSAVALMFIFPGVVSLVGFFPWLLKA